MNTVPSGGTPRQPEWPPPDPQHLLAAGLTVASLVAANLPDRPADTPVGPFLWCFAARTDPSGIGSVPPVQPTNPPVVRVATRKKGGQR